MSGEPITSFTPDQHRRVPTRRMRGAIELRYAPLPPGEWTDDV